MDTVPEKEHLVSVKVMRLTKPSLMTFHPVICDSRDLHGDLMKRTNSCTMSKAPNMDYFAVGDLLTVPQNFGNIFLGETFSSYVCVQNDSKQMCKEIIVKADLQTVSQRLSLSGGDSSTAASASSQVIPELTPSESIDEVVNHEVKELGTHILVISVNYLTQSGDKMHFTKFFKFQVLKPLDVKTKFYNAELVSPDHSVSNKTSDEIYLETQIQNITPGPIYMEHVGLDPSPQYIATELNHTEKHSETAIFGNYLNPMETRQYLYCLQPKPELYADLKALKSVTQIGKIDIIWKTQMGERGRLQTSQLQRAVPGYGEVRVTVETVPDMVALETMFTLTCKVANSSDRTMDLMVVLQNHISIGMFWCGLSGRQLGKLAPNGSVMLELKLLATSPGLQTISGLRIIDTFLKRTYEHDELAQVYVYDQGTGD